jgi:hypothetical protein
LWRGHGYKPFQHRDTLQAQQAKEQYLCYSWSILDPIRAVNVIGTMSFQFKPTPTEISAST